MLFKTRTSLVENAMSDSTISSSVRQSSVVSEDEDDRHRSYTMDEVTSHCYHNDCWIVISDKVYDVTSFLNDHPGGRDIVIEYAGRDATLAYKGVGHVQIEALLETFCIGTLTKNDRT